jgi:hypothetical protein
MARRAVPIATCPKCKTYFLFFGATQIDRCGFESFSYLCIECGRTLGCIVEPISREILVSLSEGDRSAA